MRSSRRHNPIYLTLFIIYPSIATLITTYLYLDIISPILLLGLIIGYVRRYDRLLIILSYALSIYLFGLGYPITILLSLPYPLIYPFLIPKLEEIDIEYTGFLGPSARRLLTLSILYTPLIILRPTLTLFFTIQYIWLIIITSYQFVSLRNIGVKSILIPRNMVLNRQARLGLEISSPHKSVLLVVSNWGYREVKSIEGGETLIIPYTPRNVGTVNIDIQVYAFDNNLLTSRLVSIVSREASVAPTTLVNIRYILRGIGELLARAGLPRLFGVAGAGLGEEGRGVGGRGIGERGIFGRFLRGLRGFGEEGLSRRRRGTDYLGVREFLTGDRPKDIHWKKSISRGEFYVKVFGGGGGGGGAGVSLIVVGDLLASSPEELDEITNKVLLTLYSQVRRGLYGIDTILVLVSPFNEVLYARGRLEQVLAFYIDVFQRGLVRVFYNYASFERSLGVEDVYEIFRVGRYNRFLKALSNVSTNLSRRILGVIQSIGYEYPPQYTIICGRPGGLLREHIKLLFSLSGYRYVDYSEIVARVEPILLAGVS